MPFSGGKIQFTALLGEKKECNTPALSLQKQKDKSETNDRLTDVKEKWEGREWYLALSIHRMTL